MQYQCKLCCYDALHIQQILPAALCHHATHQYYGGYQTRFSTNVSFRAPEPLILLFVRMHLQVLTMQLFTPQSRLPMIENRKILKREEISDRF